MKKKMIFSLMLVVMFVFSLITISKANAFKLGSGLFSKSYVGVNVGFSKNGLSDGYGSMSGINEGLTFGQNFQNDNLVVGISGTLGNASDGNLSTDGYNIGFASRYYEVAGKLGYTANRILVFGKIGYLSDTMFGNNNAGIYLGTGAVYGVGAEYMFNKNISGVLEWQQSHQNVNNEFPDNTINAFTIGVDYNF